MAISDNLALIAELAIGLAGFASLVAVVGQRQGRDSRELDVSRLRGMLELSLIVTGFALIPESSSPGESHPQALPEPYVNLSAHTAHIIQSHSIPYQAPSAQRAAADEHELGLATDLL